MHKAIIKKTIPVLALLVVGMGLLFGSCENSEVNAKRKEIPESFNFPPATILHGVLTEKMSWEDGDTTPKSAEIRCERVQLPGFTIKMGCLLMGTAIPDWGKERIFFKLEKAILESGTIQHIEAIVADSDSRCGLKQEQEEKGNRLVLRRGRPVEVMVIENPNLSKKE